MNIKEQGTLFIISAASGAGKTSLVRSLLASDLGLNFSISYTTREPRKGEINGIDYHFVSDETFAKMVANNEFLEYAEVFGFKYGTAYQCVQNHLEAGRDIILEIDWQGANQIMAMPKFSLVSIFIMPPSIEILAERLHTRARENSAIIADRLAKACFENSHYKKYDYLVFNDDFSLALKELKAIILAERLKVKRQEARKRNLLSELTKYEK